MSWQRELVCPAQCDREVEIEAVLGGPNLSRNSRHTSNGCPRSKTLLSTSEMELATSQREGRKSAFTNQGLEPTSDENLVSPTGVGAVP